jgi:Rieske Fe-S protein
MKQPPRSESELKSLREPEAEPLWKDEFSIDSGHDRLVSRRQFTKFLTLTSFAMFVGNLWILAKSWLYKKPQYAEMAVAKADELAVGEVKLFRYPTAKDPCIMVRTAADNVVAYSQKCTHLACPVHYSKENDRLECPCHEGFFSVKTGEVLSGPPPRPLPRVVVENRDGVLIAVGLEMHTDE